MRRTTASCSAGRRSTTGVEGEVLEIEEVSGGTEVTFGGRGGANELRWTRVIEDSSWEVGQPIKRWVDEDGRFYGDYDLGRLEPPSLLYLGLVGIFVAFARRLTALWIATWDLRRGNDTPRCGYVCLIDNPMPKVWRSLLLVWWDDPTDQERLPRPDVVFLADEETGEELTSSEAVRVWGAWIDTGRYSWAKPRWAGVKDGVFIPHRRALLGRWLARVDIRHARVKEAAPMKHGPPDARSAYPSTTRGHTHSFSKMLLWRGGGVLAMALVAGFFTTSEAVVTVL